MSEHHAKHLVRTVARAFYTDDAIVVLDALCREKYLIDHEQPGRGPLEDKFGIQAKQVRKVLQGLHDDCLVEKFVRNHRDPTAPKGTRRKKRTFWYINYLHFVKLVLLRLHLMVKAINEQEDGQNLKDTMYCCPQCGSRFDMLTAIQQQHEDAFNCAKCYRELDEIIHLVEEAPNKANNGKRHSPALKLREKRKEQIAELPGIRDGLEEALHRVQTFPIPPPTNLPGDHIENALLEHKEQQERQAEAEANGTAYNGDHPSGTHNSWINDSGQSVQVKILQAGAKTSEQMQKTAESSAVPDSTERSLPAWMTLDVTGKKSSNAIQDERERAAKRQKSAAAATANNNADLGGASALLQARDTHVGEELPEEKTETEEKHSLYETTTFVTVNGAQMRLADVTKDDENRMTGEEYEDFFKKRAAGQSGGVQGDFDTDGAGKDDMDEEEDFNF
mmetsp:Transcript_14080/g.25171  ORF Transcript_14080/g.25171 Transcript_14080/m.25171 type:complete len:448 (-) Transcript_14080:28-1371(-)